MPVQHETGGESVVGVCEGVCWRCTGSQYREQLSAVHPAADMKQASYVLNVFWALASGADELAA